MTSLALNRRQAETAWMIAFAMLGIAAFMLFAGPALAGVDTTFHTAYNNFCIGWL